MTTQRAQAIRVVASSLCFDQDPPPVRSLDKARVAAAAIVDALHQSQMIELADPVAPGTSNGGQPKLTAVDPDQDPLPVE